MDKFYSDFLVWTENIISVPLLTTDEIFNMHDYASTIFEAI